MKIAGLLGWTSLVLMDLLLVSSTTKAQVVADTQIAAAVDGVTRKDEKMFTMRGTTLAPLTNEITLPFKVKVLTNGTFKVAQGKVRILKEGQIIRNDGYLLSPDGKLVPIINHIVMLGRQVYIVRDGESSALTEPMTLPTGWVIAPDGYFDRPDGRRSRLLDGECIKLDGTVLSNRDTVTLRNGKVMVQKDGAMLTIQPLQIMGMSDGTRVTGEGTVTRPDGKVTLLTEGQILIIPGTAIPP